MWQYERRNILIRERNKISIDYFMICVIISGILIRIYLSVNHFTHYDDVGYINFLNALKRDGNGNWDVGWMSARPWTYAPLQSILTSSLIDIKLGYQLNIILGRFFSCASGIVVLIIAFRFLKGIFSKEITLLLITILSFSWENIIYSAQAEPYEVVVLFGFVLLSLEYAKFYEDWKKTIAVSILFIAGCYSHYQFFILLFAFYIAIFFTNIKRKMEVIRIVICGIINILGTIPLLHFMIQYGKFERTLNWNIGIGGAFHFSTERCPQSVFSYVLNFITENTYLIFKYFFTIASFNMISNVLAIVFIIFSILGLVRVHKKCKFLAIYSDMVFLVLMVMILKGSLTYGPSRHMLFVFPVMLILIGVGVDCFITTLKNIEINKTVEFVTGVLILCFILSLPTTIADRKNNISEEKLQEIVARYSPDFIYGFSWTNDLYLMNFDGYDNLSGSYGANDGWVQKYYNDEDIDRYIILSRNISIEEFYNRGDLQQQFCDKLILYGLSNVVDNLKNYEVIYKKEIPNGVEVEYASEYYVNYPNGYHLYVLEKTNKKE